MNVPQECLLQECPTRVSNNVWPFVFGCMCAFGFVDSMLLSVRCWCWRCVGLVFRWIFTTWCASDANWWRSDNALLCVYHSVPECVRRPLTYACPSEAAYATASRHVRSYGGHCKPFLTSVPMCINNMKSMKKASLCMCVKPLESKGAFRSIQQGAQAHRGYLSQRSCFTMGEAETDHLCIPADICGWVIISHSRAQAGEVSEVCRCGTLKG